MNTVLTSIAAVAVVLGIMILVHELGHFLAARRAGVKGIEAVKRKPLNIRTYQAVNLVGFALFVLLTIFVTYRDVVKLTA